MTLLLTLALPTEKAKAVAKQLLGLGATSAQGDQNSITAFHHIVAQNSTHLLDVLLENDRPVVMSVLNNVGSYGVSWRATPHSPLSSAIDKGFGDMAATILQLGATTTIDYDGWVKNQISTNSWARNQDPDTIKARYEDNVVQPIILAAGKDMARTVEDLVAHGADIGTLEKLAFQYRRNPFTASYQIPQSLLEVVQQKLTQFRAYVEVVPKSPETLESESFYTDKWEKGTYQYVRLFSKQFPELIANYHSSSLL